MTDSNHEILWRCVKCKKWSHAKQKPKAHQRFIEADYIEEWELQVGEITDAGRNANGIKTPE